MKSAYETFRWESWLLTSTLVAGTVAGPDAAAAQEAVEPDRPNVVLILADDMGFSDLQCYGGEVATPVLDGLARQGVRFTQFYNTARCSPTRASLLTGLYPHQAGMGHMPDGYATRVRDTFDSPAYQDHLAYGTPTVAELLRPAGYVTYMVGKWHLGYDRPQWPVDRGFDHSFGSTQGAFNYYGYGTQLDGETGYPVFIRDGEPYRPPREGFFTTDAFSDAAATYIMEHDAASPFFLYLAYNAPHWPLHAPPEDVAEYRGRYAERGWDRVRQDRYRRLVELGIIDGDWELAPRPPAVPAWDSVPAGERDAWDHEMAIYAAQIERMDRGIGRVLAALRDRGLEENTLVIFLSDNGGAAEDPNRSAPGAELGGRESYEGYGIRGAHVSSGPFRRTKKWVHEGGIATPLIVRWPAVVREGGELSHEPGHLVDLLPTVLEAAGIRRPHPGDSGAGVALEGTSLLPALRGGALPERVLYFEHEGNRAVRLGRWKLVSAYPGDWELYDMRTDRTELHDLSTREPERVDELVGLWRAWAERAGVRPWSLLEEPARP